MTDGAALPHRERKADIGMHDSVFLNIGVVANGDRLIIAAQNSAEPEPGIFTHDDLADQGRIRRDPVAAAVRELRLVTVISIDRHSSSSICKLDIESLSRFRRPDKRGFTLC